MRQEEALILHIFTEYRYGTPVSANQIVEKLHTKVLFSIDATKLGPILNDLRHLGYLRRVHVKKQRTISLFILTNEGRVALRAFFAKQ